MVLKPETLGVSLFEKFNVDIKCEIQKCIQRRVSGTMETVEVIDATKGKRAKNGKRKGSRRGSSTSEKRSLIEIYGPHLVQERRRQHCW